MSYIEVAAGVVVNDQGQVLLCRRLGTLSGLWEFPGGKREEGETLPQCLERELMEELAISVTVGEKLKTVYKRMEETIISITFFDIHYHSDAPLQLSVHDKAVWVAPTDVMYYPLCEADSSFACQQFLGQ